MKGTVETSVRGPQSSAQETVGHAETNAHLDAQIVMLDARHGERVLREVYDFLGRFVSYPSEHARVAHTLWTAHSHLLDVWDSTPQARAQCRMGRGAVGA